MSETTPPDELTADSKALPEFELEVRDERVKVLPCLVYDGEGYDDEWRPMTEADLSAVLAAMDPERRANFLFAALHDHGDPLIEAGRTEIGCEACRAREEESRLRLERQT